MISGIRSHQPESARGTIGTSTTKPTIRSRKPHRMRLAGRRLPDLFPTIMATANMVSESGAIDSPDCIALYPSTI